MSPAWDTSAIDKVLCNTYIRVMGLEDMYSQNEKKDPTEVPSYFLSALVDAGIDYATDVGNWVGDGLSAAVDYGADALTSAVNWGGDALSSLYGGADKLVGGLLPGGQAFGDGYLANLYTGADKMVGGYLPNIGGGAAMGGAGYTPQYMQAQAAFDALPGASVAHGGAHTLSPAAIQSQFDALPGVGGAKKSAFGSLFDGGMSWEKAQTMANIGGLGMGIYGLMQKPGSGSNKQQYNRLMQQPGLGTMNSGNGGGGGVRSDPAMRNSPVGGGNVPLTASATGPGGLGNPKSFDANIEKLNKSIEELSNQVDPSGGTRNPTREANDEGLGIVAPTTPAPQVAGPVPSRASFANVTKGMPPLPGRPIEQYSNNDVTSLVRDSYTNNAPVIDAASPVMSTYTNNAPVVNAISPVMRRFPVAPDASSAIIDTPSQRTASVVQNVQQPQSPAQQGIRVQVEQLNRMLSETDPSSPRFQELLAARNQFQQQLIAAR